VGSNLPEDDGFLGMIKIYSTTFFEGDLKLWASHHKMLWHVKDAHRE
jgi:hypothetical protein